jgi:glycosyltransferase involved in cell wall biosynthesis
MKVEILLSTYNGEKYLREQLDSLLAQECIDDIKISVRDDGSTDGTRDILQEYAVRHSIAVTWGVNAGVNAGMMELLKNTDKGSRFFAFCDQDDVWAPGKIKAAVAALSARPESVPLLWGCMEEMTDERLNPISMMPVPRYAGDFFNAVIQNQMAGHTQVFNRALRELLLRVPAEKMQMYDWVAYALASAFGEVIFDGRCFGKYRQHGRNAVGYELNALAQIPRRLKRMRAGALRQTAGQMAAVYENFSDSLLECYQKELARFFESRSCLAKRFAYACTTKLKRSTRLESLQFRALYLLGFIVCSGNSQIHLKQVIKWII